MAMLQTGSINTDEHQRSIPEGRPLPVGVYKGIVTKTGQKETNGKNGKGIMLEVEFDITYPEEYSNRKFWDRFNIVNANSDTVRIAIEALADLGKACGHSVLDDDEQLIGHEVVLELYIEPAKPYVDNHGTQQTGKPSNRCRKYWHTSTDIEAAKAALKSKKAVTAPAKAPSGNVAQKWGGQKPAAASVAAQPVQQAATTPATNVAPWKRGK